MVGLRVTRKENESWRECVERYSKQHGLEIECLSHFDTSILEGTEESEAAWCALYEWDCLDLAE